MGKTTTFIGARGAESRRRYAARSGTFGPFHASTTVKNNEPPMTKKNVYASGKSKKNAIPAFNIELKYKRERMKITILHIVLFLAFTMFVLFGF